MGTAGEHLPFPGAALTCAPGAAQAIPGALGRWTPTPEPRRSRARPAEGKRWLPRPAAPSPRRGSSAARAARQGGLLNTASLVPCRLEARSPAPEPLGMGVWIGVRASLAGRGALGGAVPGLSLPRDPHTTRASPRGEANTHPAVLVLPGRDAGQTRPEQLPATIYGACGGWRGRTRRGRCSRPALPQAPRGGRALPRVKEDGSARRLAEPLRMGGRAPQRKAS